MSVPVLLTCDIHTHKYGSEPVHEDLKHARRVLREMQAPCTFFFPANSSEMLCDDVATLMEDGHEIGCHGLTHVAEEYNRLPLAEQRKRLTEATGRLAAVIGQPPVSFRSPTFKVSGATVQVLDELGYRADVSVNSQRFPFLGADVYNWRLLFAPRRPYHPNVQNVFRVGSARIWEIPVSACVLPFVSNTERLLGLGFARPFFRVLHTESRLTGKPIVFMFHAEELNANHRVEVREPLSLKHFVPSRSHGLRFREYLFDDDWHRVERDLTTLLRWMAGFHGIRFLTVRDYVALLERAEKGRR